VPSSDHDKRLRAELAAELGWYQGDLDEESSARYRVYAGRKKTDRDPEKRWAHRVEIPVSAVCAPRGPSAPRPRRRHRDRWRPRPACRGLTAGR
jgi:hypothetical protein